MFFILILLPQWMLIVLIDFDNDIRCYLSFVKKKKSEQDILFQCMRTSLLVAIAKYSYHNNIFSS